MQFKIAHIFSLDSLDDKDIEHVVSKFSKFCKENKNKNFEIFIDVSQTILNLNSMKSADIAAVDGSVSQLEKFLVMLNAARLLAGGKSGFEDNVMQHSFISKYSDIEGKILEANKSTSPFVTIWIYDVGKQKPTGTLNVRFCCEEDSAIRDELAELANYIALTVDIETFGLKNPSLMNQIFIMGLVAAAIFVVFLILNGG